MDLQEDKVLSVSRGASGTIAAATVSELSGDLSFDEKRRSTRSAAR